MKNPFHLVAETFSLSNTDLAAALGVAYGTWMKALAGSVPAPVSVLEALETLGYDAEEFRREYDAWRAWRRKQQAAGSLARA